MINQELAEIFFQIADILEMKNIKWKPQAYREAARMIDAMEEDIHEVYNQGGLKLLKELPGIGEGIAKKIVEFITTGNIQEYEKLKKQVPSHINILLKIPGIGSKKVKKLNKVLNIETIVQLERAAREHKIAKIPGFGKKSEQDILEGIALMRKAHEKISLKKAQKLANNIISKLKRKKEVLQISEAGSLRRKKSLIRDIDIIAASKHPEKVIAEFIKMKNIQKIMARGHTKATIILTSGIQVDLRVVHPRSWGAGLFYFTGNKSYNIRMRKIAIKKGYKLSEYGLFDQETGKMIAGKTEQDICKKLDVEYLKPEDRTK